MCNLGRPFRTSGSPAGAIWDVPFAHPRHGCTRVKGATRDSALKPAAQTAVRRSSAPRICEARTGGASRPFENSDAKHRGRHTQRVRLAQGCRRPCARDKSHNPVRSACAKGTFQIAHSRSSCALGGFSYVQFGTSLLHMHGAGGRHALSRIEPKEVRNPLRRALRRSQFEPTTR